MVITINSDMTPEQAQALLKTAQKRVWEQKNRRKTESLRKLGGLLSRLKMAPMEIQNEMRDGWLE